jgi:ferric enterobactin receptor
MKHILVLFFSFVFVLTHAQEASDLRVTYSNKDASLVEIFEDLELQYGIRFSYATSSIESVVMDADFDNMPIQDVLDYLLSEESMEYKIISNNVLLKKADSYIEIEDENYNASLHIKGKIINSQTTNEVLGYATISISNTSIGTYSDSLGRFDIEIPNQYLNESILVSYLGFEEEVYKISELKDAYIIVSMKNDLFSIDEILIVNNEKPIKIENINNAIQLNKSQINNSTSGLMGNDIGRQIQLLPGISAHEDNSAAIKIRGSNSDETLMVLDGMPIYNANHYYGIFSSINTSYIDSVNLFKNTYPIQYGGKTGGLVELFSNSNQPLATKASINVDFLTTSGDAIIPISKNSFLTLAGRSTLKQVNNKQFNTVKTQKENDPQVVSFSQKIDDRKNDPNFTFYDLNVKYQYKNDNQDLLTFNFFRSSDDVQSDYKIKVNDFNDNELKLIILDDQSWSNTAASMYFSKNVNPRIKWNSTAYVTQYSNLETNDIKLDKKYKPGDPPPPKNNPLTADLGSNQKNELLDLSFDSHLNYRFHNQSIKIGVNAIHHDIDYSFLENNVEKLKGKDNFLEIAGYVGHNIQFWDKLSFNTSIRATYFTNLKEAKFSPRVLVNFHLSDQFLLKSSFHIENQVIRQFYYEYRGEPMELWVTAGQNQIPVLRSQNFMVGSTLKLNPFSIDVEFYQKDMTGVLEYLIPNPAEASNNANQNREYQLFEGNGLTRGIDIILSSGYENYDTYLSYTLSRSEEQFKEIFKNKFYASENDRTHQFKWVNTLSTGNFTFGLNAIYVSGRPYTDINNIGANGDVRDLDPKVRLRRIRAYHRIDISSGYKFKIGKFDASLTASVFNLMNTKNVKYIQSVSTQLNANQKEENMIVGNESELLNRTFNLGFNISF